MKFQSAKMTLTKTLLCRTAMSNIVTYQRNIVMLNTNGVADVDDVRAAVSFSECVNSTVIGGNTDLLILLHYHTKDDGFELNFHSGVRSRLTPNPV